MAMVRASRSNRSRRSGSSARCAGRTLIATMRSRRVSRARYTSPIPPAPIAPVISYGPRVVPVERRIKCGPILHQALRFEIIFQTDYLRKLLLPRRSSIGCRQIALTDGFKQHDAGGDGNIEGADGARGRDRDQKIA